MSNIETKQTNLVISTGDIKKNYEILGLVGGSNIRTKNVFKDFGAAFKSLFGGELKSYQKLIEETRTLSMNEAIKQAEELGADAIIWLNMSSSTVAAGASEILVIGTAIKFKPCDKKPMHVNIT